jgi:CRP/FNR family transcriptional regulator, dissimilatory nitrate respiration regulator
MSNWVQNLVGLVGNVVLRDAAGRVAVYLLETSSESENTIELPGLKRHTASHLNLTSETFSRVITRFMRQGLISDARDNRFEILDREALRRIAKS